MADDPAALDRPASPATPRTDRVFYGWRIVGAGTLLVFVSAGISYYGLPVFLDPLQEAHGWSKSALSLAMTWYFLVSGLAGPFLGRAVDRYGPKVPLLAGSVLMAVALLLIGNLTALWQLYLAHTLLAVGFAAVSVITVSTLITRWFIRKRARALSVSMTGVSLGGVALVPLTTYLIGDYGLRTATAVLAVVPVAVTVPLALLVIRPRPEDLGLLPDGEPEPPGGEAGGALSYGFQTRLWTRAEVLRTVPFWAITAAFVLALTGQTAFVMHQVSFLSGRIGDEAAALALSITAGTSAVSRLVMGTLADRLDKRAVTVGCFVAQALGVALVLAAGGNLPLIYLGVLVIGATIGNVYMMQSLLVGECFGLASFGAVFGLVSLFSSAASAAGPLIAGAVYDASGRYEPALLLMAAVTASGSLAALFARPALPAAER